MTAKLQFKITSDGLYAPVGSGSAPYDPIQARWDSQGTKARHLDGRLMSMERKGITLMWGPMPVSHCNTLMEFYYDLAPLGFRVYGIKVPPRSGLTTMAWQAYEGFPVGGQLVWVDEPTYDYVGAWVENFVWHFANICGLTNA